MKISEYTLGVILLIMLMSGCSTKYQSQSLSGGYSETRLGQNIFVVSFKGNGFTSREQVTDFVLLRSAEVALQNDYKYFAIIDSDKYNSIYTTNSNYSTNGYIYGNNLTTNTVKTGGMTFVKPNINNTILCFKEKPEKEMSYEAEFIVKSIKEKYSIQ